MDSKRLPQGLGAQAQGQLASGSALGLTGNGRFLERETENMALLSKGSGKYRQKLVHFPILNNAMFSVSTFSCQNTKTLPKQHKNRFSAHEGGDWTYG